MFRYISRAFAKEPWSREYFAKIRAAHQNHYEQFGDLRGVASLDGADHGQNGFKLMIGKRLLNMNRRLCHQPQKVKPKI